MSKQTAVEWLIEQLTATGQLKIAKGSNAVTSIIEQAKAMEKEQMNKNTNFICHGCGTKHTGKNDDQMYEVCKQCFINL